MAAREKVSILMVDDQPAKLVTLEAILADLNEDVVKAESADEALKILLSRDIAIILVDVCMPGMDGFELAGLIREHPRFSRTAIIFISAVHLTDADRVKAYGLGAVDYIPVPIVPELLRAKVQVFADLRRKSDELERVNAELQRRLGELHDSNQRLRLADRMATIGMLAAGLGHDMGNLLLPVRMRLESLARCDLPAPAAEDIAAIGKSTDYLQRLAASLRLLSLDPESAPSTGSTELAAWWNETQGVFRTGVARHLELAADFPADLPPVRMGKAALTQAVFNLVQNAGDALRNSPHGRISVTAAPAPTDGFLCLAVSDNGPGMNEEARRRCLEPFFTTKTREVSTGLGLTLVAALVKRAGGAVHVESQPGHGASFRLELPIAEHAGGAGENARRGVASIVLTDPRLNAHVRSVLDGLRYVVLNGDGRPAEADLLVTEGDDPRTLEAARDFARSAPGARVLVFADRAGDDEDPRIVRLERSIPPSRLRQRISAALHRAQPDAGGHA